MSRPMPPDLLKAKGKPIVMGERDDAYVTHVFRLPELSLLTQSETQVLFSHNAQAQGHPLRLYNSGKLDWVGCRQNEGQSKNAAFILMDRGSFYECVPLAGCYEFIPGTEQKIGEEEVDMIQKRQKINRAKELAAALRVTENLSYEDEDLESSKKRRKVDMSTSAAVDLPLVNDAKVRKAVAKRKKAKDLDNQAQAKSSTALGEVRKAEVDWDFEEGVVSDDEEGAALASEEVEDKDEEDIDDSEDEGNVLTNYGETLNKMLQNQKQVEADQELQKYSEDEDEEENGPKASQPTQRHFKPTGIAAPNQLQTENRVREDFMELLRAKGNVTIKMLLIELGVSGRNAKFQLIKTLISELCDIVSTTQNGEQVRCIKLKPKYLQ